jgi:hypothetical protein
METMAPFKPTQLAVYNVRAMFASLKLPNELILTILDHANYWVERQYERTSLKVLMDEEFSMNFSAAYPYLVIPMFSKSLRTSAETPKIREIEFTIVSHGKLSDFWRFRI